MPNFLTTSILTILTIFIIFTIKTYNTVNYVPAYGEKPIVVISGGTGGIGLELIKLLQNSYKIVLLTRKDSKCPKSEDIYQFAIDYQNLDNFPEQFGSFLTENKLEISKIEHFYSLHGCGHYQTFKNFSLTEMQEYLNSNLISHFTLSHFFLNLTSLQSFGLTASACADFPPKFFSLYSASKAALKQFGYAIYLERPDLRVVVAVPVGVRNTRFLQQKEMQSTNQNVNICMSSAFSVTAKKVAKVLGVKSGIQYVGWLNYANTLSLAIIGENLYGKLFWMVGLKPKNED